MNKLISNSDIVQLAKEMGIDFAKAKAVMLVESSGTGFDSASGLIKIQFEPHHFKLAKIENGVGNQKIEWAAYQQAKAINVEKAMMATSWGLGQIMGFNFKDAGYASVQAMVNEFQLSEYYQAKAMFNFIRANKAMFKALREGDWKTFANLYNGPTYYRLKYDEKLAEAHAKALTIKI